MALRVNRLALNASLPVAGAAAVAACVGALVASGGAVLASLLVGVAVGMLAGGVAYTSVYARVARRLQLAGEVLREARKRRFDALAQIPTRRSATNWTR